MPFFFVTNGLHTSRYFEVCHGELFFEKTPTFLFVIVISIITSVDIGCFDQFCTCSGGLLRICRYLISKLTWFEEVAIAQLYQAKNTMQIRLREQEVGEMHLGFLEIFDDSEVNSSQPAQPSMVFFG